MDGSRSPHSSAAATSGSLTESPSLRAIAESGGDAEEKRCHDLQTESGTMPFPDLSERSRILHDAT